MTRRNAGFGLIELLIALALGVLLVSGATQVFLSARETYLAQYAAAIAQEDARFVLSKIAQEIRMIGMFGCLSADSIINAPAVFQTPVSWQGAAGSRSWRFVSGDVGLQGTRPDWTVVSDCKRYAQAYAGQPGPLAPGETAFALRNVVYWFENGQLKTGPGKAVLLDNVAAFEVMFGVAGSAAGASVQRYEQSPSSLASIRSLKIVLTLRDPKARVKDQTYHLVVALRNRLG